MDFKYDSFIYFIRSNLSFMVQNYMSRSLKIQLKTQTIYYRQKTM